MTQQPSSLLVLRRGKYAEYITENHSLNFGLGMDSPLEKIYELEGYVLLIGTGHDSNTSLHLAEYRANYGSKKIVKCWAPVNQKGERVWKGFYDINLECSDFNQIGKDYETRAGTRQARVGQAKIRLLDQRSMVDFATKWMEQNRK
ncbi:MAG: AAC(3) family N-acetyltransferase [Actinomycetota bacterium]|nr:AAC(3) family N-acetyltransferase [Actinomycetota bacterium]